MKREQESALKGDDSCLSRHAMINVYLYILIHSRFVFWCQRTKFRKTFSKLFIKNSSLILMFEDKTQTQSFWILISWHPVHCTVLGVTFYLRLWLTFTRCKFRSVFAAALLTGHRSTGHPWGQFLKLPHSKKNPFVQIYCICILQDVYSVFQELKHEVVIWVCFSEEMDNQCKDVTCGATCNLLMDCLLQNTKLENQVITSTLYTSTL